MSTIKKAGKGSRPVTVMSRALESGDLNESSHREVTQEQFDRTMNLLDEWFEERESYYEFMGTTPLQGKHQKLLENCRTTFARAKEYRNMIQRPSEIWWGLAMLSMGQAAESVMTLQKTLDRFIKQSPIRATQAKKKVVNDRRSWLANRIQDEEVTPEEVRGTSRKRLIEQYTAKWNVTEKTFSRDLKHVCALSQHK